MSDTITLALSKTTAIAVPRLIFVAAMITVMIGLPIVYHQQLVTGILVNMILLLLVVTAGPAEAVAVGLVPSVAALTSGLLPVSLAPAVPYIMVGNALYIYVFFKLYKKYPLLAVVAGSLTKSAFLIGSTHLALSSLLQSTLMSKATIMMGPIQLATAITGGLLALGMMRLIKLHTHGS